MQDPFAAKIGPSPYGTYARLRAEEPVYWSSTLRAWVLTRLDDVQTVLGDDAAFPAVEIAPTVREISRRSGRSYDDAVRFLDAILFFKTGPVHARDRRTLSKVVNRVPLSRLRPMIAALADEYLDKIAGRDRFDIVAEFAEPFPHRVMALILGLPAEGVAELDALLGELTLMLDPAMLDVFDRVNIQLATAHRLIAERVRAACADPEPSGLKLIYEAAPGDDDERLALTASTALFVYRVGAETTIGLIGCAAKALLDDPGLYDRLREQPERIGAFVSEVLRLEANVQRSMRVARETRRIGNKTVEAGQRVMLLLGAANRDPERVCPADAVRLDAPGEAVAFGHGLHYCLGASLAKLEGAIAVEGLLRLGALRQDGPEAWFQGSTIRRMTALPVRRVGAPSLESVR